MGGGRPDRGPATTDSLGRPQGSCPHRLSQSPQMLLFHLFFSLNLYRSSAALNCWMINPFPPWWLSSKESACNAGETGDMGLIPGPWRSPGEGNGHPLQRSHLGNPMESGTLLLLSSHFRHIRLFATPWTVTHQAPPAKGFPRQEYWSEVPFPSLGKIYKVRTKSGF